MNEFNIDGNQGYYQDADNLISFQIGADTPGIIDIDKFNNLNLPVLYNVGQHKVLIKGNTNLLPEEIQLMIGGNRLLPELIEKQMRILYGQGPQVYKKGFEKNKLIRHWEEKPEITDWMDSWQPRGLQDSAEHFFMKTIRDFYYFEDYWIKWKFSKSRRTNGPLPVIGLEHVDNRRCRLATGKNIDLTDDPVDQDFQTVVAGNWQYGNVRKFKIYKRFNHAFPLQSPVAISYHKNDSVGKVYGENKYYAGIKEWLTGMNRNPKYINSFLKNSLSAKIHLVIPVEWVESVEQKIRDYCEENKVKEDAGKTLIKLNGIEIGVEYKSSTRDKYIAAEIKKLSSFLSGVENQGKLYATYAYTTADGNPVQWKLEPIDLKYKEFISSLTDYDKRADEVTLAAKGLDASISSISKEGVISKSGSDLYYNYIIYLHNLSPAEHICNEVINYAIRINFPGLYKQGYRVGFYNEVPSKQEDVSPNDRLQNNMNHVTQQVNELKSEVNKIASQIN
ncbi:MAG: hypothetical protein KAR19_03730 [Bacteroidales bacterium]|nr:hypothetical protein [Bacteroidales bacterium]